mmetsp:Transcript_24278/g.67511  ORF Transcript_24278/g.67511 Transcript_24278/m.67511 type:complete len:261 (-) Transcript_24278:115-897(-)
MMPSVAVSSVPNITSSLKSVQVRKSPALNSLQFKPRQCPRSAAVSPACSSRREALAQHAALVIGAGSLTVAPPSLAAFAPPAGYRLHVDKLDGYRFIFPETWITVTTSGNDVCYRNPASIEENLFVNISSPSSSKYQSVADLGSPEKAAQRLKDQYLDEFMSTRIGVRRETEVVSAQAREAPDGKSYYDIEVRIKSYATRSQLAVTQAERAQELEFDRRLITTLGTAQGRLYELRIQTSSDKYESLQGEIAKIQQSFRCV